MPVVWSLRNSDAAVVGEHVARLGWELGLSAVRVADACARRDEFVVELEMIGYAKLVWKTHQVANMARQFNPGRIGKEIRAFERAVPTYKKLRDVTEHFDDHEAGRDSRSVTGVHAALRSAPAFADATIDAAGVPSLHVAHLSLNFETSMLAVMRLLGVVREVVWAEAAAASTASGATAPRVAPPQRRAWLKSLSRWRPWRRSH